MTATARAARIAQLRKNIARRALDVVKAPADTRIIDARLIGTVLVVATEQSGNRWASVLVETFRLPAADDTDLRYDEAEPPRWIPLAGWSGHSADEVPSMLAEATAYAQSI
ncbi:hypothetical protein ABZX74_15565 [Streptomyces olivaceoviridis]|uniref:hypothetical protein n=1 Tax=Streptomyces olivaceoviridis TaxID=1921 RepID=UPI0033ABB19E